MQAIQGTMPIPKTAIPIMREGVSRQLDLEELFLAHKDRVFRAAYRVTGSASDAEDVLQTVFLRLMRHTPGAEISNPGSYLHRSAVNAALDLLRAAFPVGSITGAPKLRAMEIIAELEPSDRSVYCGAIGYWSVTGASDTNIAIRTAILRGDRVFFSACGGGSSCGGG